MPTVANDGVTLYYETDGEGETVAFVGDLGYGAWQWGWQHAAVAGPYEALVSDVRGAGRSDAPPGPYTVPDLVADLEAVLSDAAVRRAYLVGAGLGGMVALAASRRLSRVAGVVLLGTAAWGEGLDLDPLFGDPADPASLRDSFAAAVSESFRADHPGTVEQVVEWRAAEDADRDAWRAQAAAVEGFDARDRLHEITVPALVVHGTADAVWPVERGRALAEGLPRGSFHPVEGAGHLVGVERSRAVNDRLVGFLESDGASG